MGYQFEVCIDGEDGFETFRTFDNREDAIRCAMSDCDGYAFKGDTVTVNRVSCEEVWTATVAE